MDMEELAHDWEPWFKQFIPLYGGPPSHDTFNRVFQMIEPARFESCFRAWTEQIRQDMGVEIIALDGKTCCGSKSGTKPPISIVSVWACANRLVLGQLSIKDKGHEIQAVQELLKSLVLNKTVVTADALNCQKETAGIIMQQGGDYVLALKGNQPLMHQEVKLFLNELSLNAGPDFETIDKGHGRLETRKFYQTADINWFADLDQWPGLKSFGMVHSVRELSNGEAQEERRFYISSLPYNPELFAQAVRDHWGIENKLHWCLDVSFGEDLNRARTKNAATNLNTLRKIAMNILRREPSNKSLIQKQRKAARSPQFLLTLLKFDA